MLSNNVVKGEYVAMKKDGVLRLFHHHGQLNKRGYLCHKRTNFTKRSVVKIRDERNTSLSVSGDDSREMLRFTKRLG